MRSNPTRRAVFLSGLAGTLLGAVLVSALVLTVLPVDAATGDQAILGRTNLAGKSTVFRSGNPSTLKVITTNPAGPALELQVPVGSPPLKVSSPARIPKLNADRVDGRNANQLIRVAWSQTEDVAEGIFTDSSADVRTAQIVAPKAGILVIDASVEVFGSPDRLTCLIEVNGTKVTGTRRDIAVSSEGTTDNGEENCSTNGARAVPAGTYTVDLHVLGWSTNSALGGANLWVLWVPFDGQGRVPGGFIL